MNSAIFPHTADHYKVAYGIQRRIEGQWVPHPTSFCYVGPAAVHAIEDVKKRDEVLERLRTEYPKTQFRKVTIHVAINVIPVSEEDPSETGKTKA